MRKLFVFVAVLGLVAGSCGGGSADSCEGVANEAADAIQAMIDGIDDMDMSLQEIFAADEPAFLTEAQAKLEELGQKAEDLNCTEEEMNSLMAEEAGKLTAKSDAGKALLEGYTSDVFN